MCIFCEVGSSPPPAGWNVDVAAAAWAAYWMEDGRLKRQKEPWSLHCGVPCHPWTACFWISFPWERNILLSCFNHCYFELYLLQLNSIPMHITVIPFMGKNKQTNKQKISLYTHMSDRWFWLWYRNLQDNLLSIENILPCKTISSEVGQLHGWLIQCLTSSSVTQVLLISLLCYLLTRFCHNCKMLATVPGIKTIHFNDQ